MRQTHKQREGREAEEASSYYTANTNNKPKTVLYIGVKQPLDGQGTVGARLYKFQVNKANKGWMFPC